jgi:hypothetical protein
VAKKEEQDQGEKYALTMQLSKFEDRESTKGLAPSIP